MARYTLSEDDRSTLRRWIAEEAARVVNPRLRSAPFDDPDFTNDVYAVLTPPTGIRGLGEGALGTGTGTGTGTGIDDPGQAQCLIYQLIPNAEQGGTVPDLVYTGYTVTTYNLSRTAVPGNIFVPVAREKWGSWVVLSPGTGGSPLTTKGDVYGHSTVDARIPVGSDGQVLTADSTQALGLKWAAAGGSSFVGASISRSGAPNITGTATQLTGGTADFDTNSFKSTDALVIPGGLTGKYMIGLGSLWNFGGVVSGTLSIEIRLNTAAVCAQAKYYNFPGASGDSCSRLIALSAGDSLTAFATQGLGVTTSTNWNFWLQKVG